MEGYLSFIVIYCRIYYGIFFSKRYHHFEKCNFTAERIASMKRQLAVLTVSALVYLCAQAAISGHASADTLTPNQDGTWVNGDAYFGEPENYVGNAPSPMDYYRSAIQFQLPNLTGKVVTKATLRINVTSIQADSTIVPFLTVYGSTVDTWNSSSSFPQNDTDQALDSVTTNDDLKVGWVELDVTDFVNAQTDGIVSFALRSNESIGGPGAEIDYTADDNLTNQPQLVLELADATPPAPANEPSVTSATTQEDTPTATGLQLTADDSNGVTTNYYKITGITGGTLYKHNGSAVIADGEFITTAEGAAGLTFTPSSNASGTTGFGFDVQAAPAADDSRLSSKVPATITVTDVNDPPAATNDTLSGIDENAAPLRIPMSVLLANDSVGPSNENGQTLTVALTGTSTGGTATVDGEDIVFTPAPNYHGTASFDYRITDDGTTNGNADPQTDSATVSFAVHQVAGIPSVTSASTLEDNQSSSGLVVTRNPGDGPEVQYFKISNIQGGSLYKNDGSTPIFNNSYITVAEGAAGLKFSPNDDANTGAGDTFSFDVQASLDDSGTGLSEKATPTITVAEVNDAPTATDDTWSDIDEDAAPIRIPMSALLVNDSMGPSNESGQTLTLTLTGTSTGGTATVDGDDIVFAPEPNYNGPASFEYQIADNGTTDSDADPQTDSAAVSFVINFVADVPHVTNASTVEDSQTGSGLVITPSANDAANVQYFKIGNIQGGKLYRNDGTTEIANNSFVPRSEGEIGLKFSPDPDANSDSGETFSFDVQASLDNSGTGLSEKATATITVSADNDNPDVADDHLGPIAENSGDHAILASELLGNDTPGAYNELDQTMSIIQVNAVEGGQVRLDSNGNVVFTPDTGFYGDAAFSYKVQDSGGLTNQVTAYVTVSPLTDRPTVTNASTDEDTKTTTGLIITPTSDGGSTTTHFKISGISGGTLYQHDGMTPIRDGDIITVAEGSAGLVFEPIADAHGTTGFGFNVQAAADGNGALLSEPVQATISVNEVNDAPTANDDNLAQVPAGTPLVAIPYSSLTANDVLGPNDEQLWQTPAIVNVESIAGGTVALANGRVEFTPEPGFTGTAKFSYTVLDDGRTNGSDDPQSDTATVSFTIADDTKPTITLNGDQTIYLHKGESYQEPGYSADDDIDGDLTDRVTVTGSVNTDVIGTYLLHYNVTDNSNNDATEVTRTVQVVSDKSASYGNPSSNSGFAVIVNGQKQEQIATASTAEEGNSTTITATIDTDKLENQLAALGDKPMVIVPVTSSADKISTVLTGESVKALKEKHGTLRIETPIAAYDIPANLVAIDKVSAQFGSATPLSDITVNVEIAASSAEKTTQLQQAGLRQGFTLTGKPVDFSIEATHDGKTVEVDKFNSYVEREIAIPEGVDPSKITTAVVLNADGTVHHVPTMVTVRDGKYFATINSLTNSSYSLIFNKKSFQDVSNHWSKEAVEDMASRLVINGTDDTHFNPNAPITRAEFAAIVVRGLGLAEDKPTDKFKDVKPSDWYSGAVEKAVEYGLVQGYEDGTFGPNKTITREEALVLISRAMDVANMEGIVVDSSSALGKFADSLEVSPWAKADVAKTVDSGLAQGTGQKLAPKANITRAETATLIQRLLSKFNLINDTFIR